MKDNFNAYCNTVWGFRGCIGRLSSPVFVSTVFFIFFCFTSNVFGVEDSHLDASLVKEIDGTSDVEVPAEEIKSLFRQAVLASFQRSPEVKRALADKSASEEEVLEAKGQRWPQVNIGAQTKSKEYGEGIDNRSSGGWLFTMVTPVYDWGAIRSAIASRENLAEAAGEQVEAERENAAFNVLSSIINLARYRLIVESSQAYVNRMQELVTMLSGVVAVDTGRASELTQARARLLGARGQRDAAEAKSNEEAINLQKYIGNSNINVPNKSIWGISNPDLNSLLDSIALHPTVKQAKSRSEAAMLEAKSIRASTLPSLTWEVSKSTEQDVFANETPWQTYISVNWAAFSGGSIRSAKRAALHRSESQKYEAQFLQRDLEFRIRSANLEGEKAKSRADLYRELVIETDKVRRDYYQQWYHLGKRTLLDVLTAETGLYDNQVKEIESRFDAYIAIIMQYAAAGELRSWLSIDEIKKPQE
ncbi:TolC family protein [Microbulbifer pacificus]|uniref:TolC family protein n=1 Tax=Microbulbifer pacificus TaxID=407164 RepID=UPI000CF3702A|nr:TolC family protein [Microbulbifer pacificus]